MLLPDRPRRRGRARLGLRRLTQPPIEDYALIGDCRSAALVSRAGSVDWLCWPRFDSPACFAALLGAAENGRWRIAPNSKAYGAEARGGEAVRVTRSYLAGGMILETRFEVDAGSVALIDFMPPDAAAPTLIRIVEGRAGRVAMQMDLTLRFDYGAAIPRVTDLDEECEAGPGIDAVAGPDRAVLRSGVRLRGDGAAIVADFAVAAGERAVFVLSHGLAHEALPAALDPAAALAGTVAFWTGWSARGTYLGPWKDAVERSLLTLKALTCGRTGGIVAAPTTSLPELPGGSRNWDYRFCWLRDSALTLRALMRCGHLNEAVAWRDWLVRAIAGSPNRLQVIYGVGGERRLAEWEPAWLTGYQGARPVRIGNAAAGQLQIDVYGEVMDALYQAARAGASAPGDGWQLQVALMVHLETAWEQPDEGIWEVRGGRRQFTYSKVMAWVAFDRAIRCAEEFSLSGPLDRWRQARALIHATICARGVDASRGCFVQSFGAGALDASLLRLPLVGFLPVDDPRVQATIAAIERDLTEDGLVLRYRTEVVDDGMPPGEGVFLACSFWLTEVMALQGRHGAARRLFARLLALRNDVGLLAEEYDPRTGRLLGNFPQGFSHLALIDAALRLAPD